MFGGYAVFTETMLRIEEYSRKRTNTRTRTRTHLLFLRLDFMADSTSADDDVDGKEGLAEAVSVLRPDAPAAALPPPMELVVLLMESREPD